MVIRTFDAPAGSGKTRALARYADRLARYGHKVLFAQPTRHLIDKTVAEELLPLDPTYPVRPIHGGAALSNSVVADLVAHFQNAPSDRGQIVLITHAAFMILPFIERKHEWVLIMDEVPQVDRFEELRLSETHHLITPHLDLVPGGAAYGQLVTPEDARAAREDAR